MSMSGITKVGNALQETTQMAEKEFYAAYSGCLNPYLTLREQFLKLLMELDRYDNLHFPWQREECIINIYLFLCSVTCTIDDYLACFPISLFSIVKKYPQFEQLLVLTERIINLPYKFRHRAEFHQIAKVRNKWDKPLEKICKVLIDHSELSRQNIIKLKTTITRLIEGLQFTKLLERKMKINEGFRCQDLTHYDILSMAEKYVSLNNNKHQPVLVIGPRTAGAYFAPLVKVFLKTLGYEIVESLTIRPAFGISSREKRHLKSFIQMKPNVLIVDDYPNTGFTLAKTANILQHYGLAADRIVLMAPSHPIGSDWLNDKSITGKWKTITLEHSMLYKNKFFESPEAESLLQDYLKSSGWEKIEKLITPEIQEHNSHFEESYSNSFQVRLKHLYEFKLLGNNQINVRKKILVKSVGWGWFGYHAYLIQSQLGGFVTKIFGLRNGLLFMEWLEHNENENVSGTDNTVKRLSAYIAERSRKLSLDVDPRKDGPDYGWGWLEISRLLRRAYGKYLGRLKNGRLLKEIQNVLKSTPTIIDGRVGPDEWIKTKDGLYKTDFEQHNFGAPELDIVDPAYDLASAVFEFQLSEQLETLLLNNYYQVSGDKTIRDRILPYKVLYGTVVMRRAAEMISRSYQRQIQERENHRYLAAWNFLVLTLQRFCSQLIKQVNNRGWTDKLFFLDLDGVFDSETFGFPHTTLNGLTALSLLQKHGYSVVINSGRSVQQVNSYCSYYGLPGGVAEYGSVFIDAVRGTEIPLIDSVAAAELELCRNKLMAIPGIFIDSSYRYAVRAYRYKNYQTTGIEDEEINQIIKELNCERISWIRRSADTYFVQSGVDKGTAMESVKKKVKEINKPVAAIGDAKEDVSMLKAADRSYAPANCSREIKKLSRQGFCKIILKPRQRGLLDAVVDLTGENNLEGNSATKRNESTNSFEKLMLVLLEVADQSRLQRLVHLIK